MQDTINGPCPEPDESISHYQFNNLLPYTPNCPKWPLSFTLHYCKFLCSYQRTCEFQLVNPYFSLRSDTSASYFRTMNRCMATGLVKTRLCQSNIFVVMCKGTIWRPYKFFFITLLYDGDNLCRDTQIFQNFRHHFKCVGSGGVK